MKLLEQLTLLLSQNPLPDDAPAQLDQLIAKATGLEKQRLIHSYEALYAAATKEQYVRWSTETEKV